MRFVYAPHQFGQNPIRHARFQNPAALAESSLGYAGQGFHDGARQTRGGLHDQARRRWRTGDQFGRRRDGDDPPAIHDGDPIAQVTGFLEIMSAEKDGPAIRPQLANEAAQRAAGLRIETGGGLVEHQQSGPVDQRQGEKQPLPLPRGKRGEGGVGFVLKTEAREKVISGEGIGVERAEEVQGLARSDPILQGGCLELGAHEPFRPGGVRPQVQTVNLNRAGIELPQSEDAFEGCGLAGAVGPQKAEDLARALPRN